MSEEQRNQQPHEEEGPEGADAPHGSTEAGRGHTGVGGPDAGSGRSAYDMTDGIGEGSPRYGDTVDEIPAHGSEQSWSSAPHPGYVADPKLGYSNRRAAAGVLIGCLVLALGVFYGVRILTGRSSNGFGAAPWTATVQQGGAQVNGINAQNSGAAPPIEIPADVTFSTGGGQSSDAVNQAIATCQATTNGTHQPSTVASSMSVANWAGQAGPTIAAIRSQSVALNTAVASKDQAAVAAASDAMCRAFIKAEALPPMPDAEGAKAWVGGITDYARAASNALKGVSGDPEALQTAADDIKDGDAQFAALTTQITTATA